MHKEHKEKELANYMKKDFANYIERNLSDLAHRAVGAIKCNDHLRAMFDIEDYILDAVAKSTLSEIAYKLRKNKNDNGR